MATATVRMRAPTTRHAELVALELAATERVQDFLDLATNMRPYPHAPFFQRFQQRFGQGGAEEHVHVELGHTACQRVRLQRPQQYFPPPQLRSPAQRDDEQSRGRVEQWRNAILPGGTSYSHD